MAYYFGVGFLAHLALAAFWAISFRCFLVNLAARALPPWLVIFWKYSRTAGCTIAESNIENACYARPLLVGCLCSRDERVLQALTRP